MGFLGFGKKNKPVRGNGVRYTASKDENDKIMEIKAGRKNLKKFAIAGVTFALATSGAISFSIQTQKNRADDTNKNIVSQDLVNTVDESAEEKIANEAINDLENKAYDIDKVSNDKEALEYMKQQYVNEYNKSHGTDYTIDQISIVSSSQDYVYDINDGESGQRYFVSHGSTPGIVDNKISSDAQYKSDIKMYTSYLQGENGDKEALEAFCMDGNEIVNTILGDDFLKGKELDENNTLKDMGKIIKDEIDLYIMYHNNSGKSLDQIENYIVDLKESIKNNIGKYNNSKSIEDLENQR